MLAATEASAPSLQIDDALVAARCCSLAFMPPAAADADAYASQGPSSIKCIGQVEDAATQTGATMFTTSDGCLVIACRGSSSVQSFRTNLNIGPVPLMTARGAHPTARVHAGFQAASKELWRQLEPLLPSGVGGRDSSMRVMLTGHSLGGGTATMIALKLRERLEIEPSLITIAGPRLGNGAFREHYRSLMPRTPAYHMVHDTDDVIASNTQLWDDLGFEHVGIEVRVDKDRPCLYDDPPICSADGGPPSLKKVFVDHCQYLGYYIGLRMEHPSVWLRKFW